MLFVNHIGDSGALSLSEALKVNSSLTHLDLEGLMKHSCVKTNCFYCIYNNIGLPGVLSLSEALKVNSSLTLLELSQNGFSFSYDHSLLVKSETALVRQEKKHWQKLWNQT